MFVPENRVVLKGSDRSPVHQSKVAGPSDPAEIIEVTLRLRHHPKADNKSLNAATRLSREEYETRFGSSNEDIQAVENFAHTHELTVVLSEPGRHTVILKGTVAQFSAAFGVELRQYEHSEGQYRGRTGPVYIPSALEGIVTGVFGLDNRPQAKPHFRHRPIASERALGSVSGTFTPIQVADAYSFPNADGTGQCIAIIELGGGYSTSDLTRYFQSLNLSKKPKITAVSVGGAHNSPTGDPSGPDGEVMLDIEVAGSIAPGASIAVYFAQNTDAGFLNAITQAVHDKTRKPSVVSISWGGPESTWTQQALDSYNEALQTASTLGVTVCIASGDNGATDGVTDGQNHVDFPASSPYALGCGGTRLVLSGNQITETVWNDGANGGATGGGFSAYFPIPDYQVGVIGNGTNRGVPDVAGDADPNSGYNVIVDGQSTVIGGTSAVAPLMSALIARINQSLTIPVGFINSLLYKAPQDVRDIVNGTNNGFSAGPGWDPCTGMGVPIGTQLQSLLAAAVKKEIAA